MERKGRMGTNMLARLVIIILMLFIFKELQHINKNIETRGNYAVEIGKKQENY